MKKIALTQGKFALVDDEDFEYLNQWKWYANKSYTTETWYAERSETRDGKKKVIRMHRFILGVHKKDILIDHIDRDGLNNQKLNLRQCTPSQNQANRSKNRGNVTSVYRGVSWIPDKKLWRACVTVNRKSHYAGKFKNEIDAAKAYNKVASKFHGEFANLNNV